MLKYTQAANPHDDVTRGIDGVIARGKTPYQEYLFFRSKMHGVSIALDGDIQSCASDEGIYHEALVHPAMLLHPAPKQVLIMGGGEGATAREVLRHRVVEKVVMVDIDEAFVTLCRTHIPEWSEGVWDDPRLEVRYEDIHQYLRDCGETFDVVIGDLVDVTDPDSPAAALYSGELYRGLKTRLGDNAVVATQAGPLAGGALSSHNRIRRTFGGLFSNLASLGIVVPSFYHLWGFVLASDAPLVTAPGALLHHFGNTAGTRGLTLRATGVNALVAAFSLPQLITVGLE
jgi:spermidine synthase